jgi:predicted DNA binding CopG/RHH family protein|tara:strand:+ start:1032 stop:1181 length:150 start_codon:yes stop_codon:yes gene_type:complete
MNKENLTTQIGVRFYKSDLSKIKEVAQKERINLSAYVRKVVSKHIDDEK